MNNFLQMGLMVYFLSGTLYLTDTFKKFQQPLLLISLTVITIAYFLCKRKFYHAYIGDFIHISFTTVLLLSAIYNWDIKNLAGSICMFLIYIIICVVLPNIPFYNPLRTFNKIINIHIFIFLISIVTKGISLKSYEGIFGNPNSLGGVAVALLSISLSLLNYKIEQRVKGNENESKGILLNIFLVLFWIFFIVCSSSRTSFLTAILLILISILILSKEILSYHGKNPKNVFIRYIFLILIAVVIGFTVCSIQPIRDAIQTSILEKFEKKSDDVLDGRSERWVIVLEEMSILGYGSKHYKLAPHNTFISILGQYGIIATILYIIFLLFILRRAIKFIKIKKNICYKYIPLMALISFVMLSMAEAMMLKTSMLIIYFSLSLIRKIDDQKGEV